MLSIRPKLLVLTLIMALSLPILSASPGPCAEAASQEKFSFTILHSNDLHSHDDNYIEHGKNLGGLPRIAYLIKEERKKNPNVLVVDAGDIFQGTAFFEQYKGETDVECLNKAGYDVYTIGNHEFDEGTENLGKQLKKAKFDVVSCNLDVSAEPNLKEVVKPSVVKEIGGQKVGFIGVITPALKELAPRLGELKLISPGPHWMEPVRAEIEKLKGQGINKIVLVSHCGVDMERLLAALDGVDVIVGGHSHTRLDEAIVVPHADGTNTMVVQTGCYGRALGKMDLVFDKDGKLLLPESKYKLINITDKVPEDKELKAFVTEKGKPFEYLTKTILSTAAKPFDHRFKSYTCDSPIGDLICDALFDASIDNGATISLQNRGGIRGGLDAGPISIENVREILPFQNKLVVGTVSGRTLLGAMEHSAAVMGGTGGQFLDVHGLKFAWDPTLELGHRILYLFAQNKEGAYEKVEADDLYRIAINDYTFGGGEGYDFKDAKDIVQTGLRLSKVLEDYLKKHKEISPVLPTRFLRVSSNIAKRDGDKILIDYPAANADLTVVAGTDVGVSYDAKFAAVPLQNPKLILKTNADDSGALQLAVTDLLSKAEGTFSKSAGKSDKAGSKKSKSDKKSEKSTESGKSSDKSSGDEKAKSATEAKIFVSVILQAKDKDGTETRIVSVPIQIR